MLKELGSLSVWSKCVETSLSGGTMPRQPLRAALTVELRRSRKGEQPASNRVAK